MTTLLKLAAVFVLVAVVRHSHTEAHALARRQELPPLWAFAFAVVIDVVVVLSVWYLGARV